MGPPARDRVPRRSAAEGRAPRPAAGAAGRSLADAPERPARAAASGPTGRPAGAAGGLDPERINDPARRPRAERLRRRELLAAWVEDAVHAPPRYRDLRCPALAFAPRETVASVFPWLAEGDPLRERAAAFLRDVRGPWRQGALARFAADTPLARVAEVGAHHWLHVTDAARVAEEMLAFLTRAGVGR